ncbi:hypothetical protein RUMCAL_01393 [Ruminococcus callidus ATCC 27760]|uniref:Uncharacterized protein n=1 Tax=Ruminococcus callidus ATCC 27760 TaxID=411473 RepID=U2MAB4_9FIRM|nr:hypothetical protein RUMCAL_01393 [Ruminococcus callidus ATCC 27760]
MKSFVLQMPDEKVNAFSAMFMKKSAAQNLVNAFGFLQWRIKQSVRDFQIFVLTVTMTTYMQLDFVGQRQTGLLD